MIILGGDLEYGICKGCTIIWYTEFHWNFKSEFSLEFLIVWEFWIFLGIFLVTFLQQMTVEFQEIFQLNVIKFPGVSLLIPMTFLEILSESNRLSISFSIKNLNTSEFLPFRFVKHEYCHIVV